MGYLLLLAILIGLAWLYWPVTIAVVAVIGWWIFRRVQQQRRVAMARRHVSKGLLILDAHGQRVEVVGEGNYQGTLEIIAGGRTVDGAAQRDHIALLWPEPDNIYDSNAIRVVIEEAVVGYLSAKDAPLYRPLFDRALAAGRYPAAHAVIRGGWDRGGGDRGSFGVVLSLGTPDEVRRQVDAALSAS